MTLDPKALDALRMDKDAAASAAARRATPWIIAGTIAAILVAAAVAWFLLRPETIAVSVTLVEEQGGAGTVAQASVLSGSGYVVARRISTPSAKITAQVRAVYVEEGMSVQEGDVLAHLDDSTPRAQLALAESRLVASRRSVKESEVRLVEARRTLDRNKSLQERDLVSQSVLDASDAEVNALQARIAAGNSEVDVAERSVAVARQAVEDTIIRAPFAGVVVTKDAQPGEMISPISAGGGFTRTGICTIVDMGSLEIEVDVNEAFINRVNNDQRVVAVLDAYPEWKIAAHVISIVPTADRQKATVKVRIGLDEKDPRILPDMGVQVQFLESAAPAEGTPAGRRPTVAEGAITQVDGANYAFVVHGQTVEKRAVRTGMRRQGTVEIEAGLQAGETVVLNPPPELRDGMAIEIQE